MLKKNFFRLLKAEKKQKRVPNVLENTSMEEDDKENLCADGAMRFTIASYPKEAFEVMSLMRQHQKLCAMFTSGLKESEMSVINIQGVCPLSMAIIIHFAYTGQVKIEENNVCNLLPAATMFQVPHIIDACCSFLENQLDPSNCIGIADFALQHSCNNLYAVANQFIDQHFSQVSQGEEFLALSALQMIKLIKRDELNVRSEMEVFNAVLRWVKHDKPRRCPRLSDILNAVRCHFLTPRFLKEQMQKCEVLKNEPQCCDYLSRIIQDLTSRRKYSCNQRTPKVPYVIYTTGGYLQHSLSNMECYNAQEKQWFSLADLPTPRSGLGGAFIDGKFYAVGGRNNCLDGNQDSDGVDCYDPITNKWKSCCKMTIARNRVGVGVLDGLLYAVGGSKATTHHNTVERYDPAEDKWSRVQNMLTSRIGVGVAVVKRLLYAVGGYDGNSRLNTVECYHPEKDSWTQVASMNTNRSGAGVVALEHYIYAVGGYDGALQLKSVERYDTETDEWVYVSEMSSPRSALSVAVSYEGCTNFLNTVEVYDPEKDAWEAAPNMTLTMVSISSFGRAPMLDSEFT
ncbi:Kelch-like ECH-associated protein 1 like protein [Argiope bruennichi]|uniref:Kelch-like protein diablo n=1 Tax=Argiope bruennichi TaxID=94029 RepID=A0A8T0EKX4_ARGBR|nr:Kelch-like ECH-associated protein 1 like protein [Argiope bruennichi]